MLKPNLPKGTRDFDVITTSKRQYIIETIETQFKKYGFNRIETPALENLSVLMGKYGDEGDQLIFKILNSGDYLKDVDDENFKNGSKEILSKISEKGLRYDLTVPFARFVAMNQHQLNFPFKRYQIQPVWRADRPQKGRYREFYQCDADVIGTTSLWNETELILLIHDIFFNLNFQDFKLKINHRVVLFALAQYVGMSQDENNFCLILDKIKKIGKEQVVIELVEKGANHEKTHSLIELLEDPNQNSIASLSNLIGAENDGIKDLQKLLQTLSHFKDKDFKVEIDFSLARGLSYYTGIIYEVVPTSMQMGSICGGGRYANLTEVFGLTGMSGVGISFGLDRIYDVLEYLNLFPQKALQTIKVLITHFDELSFEHSIIILEKLRSQNIYADIYPDISKLKKQISFANKIGVPFVITVGEEEIKNQKYVLKDMNSNSIETLNIDEIILKLSN